MNLATQWCQSKNCPLSTFKIGNSMHWRFGAQKKTLNMETWCHHVSFPPLKIEINGIIFSGYLNLFVCMYVWLLICLYANRANTGCRRIVSTFCYSFLIWRSALNYIHISVEVDIMWLHMVQFPLLLPLSWNDTANITETISFVYVHMCLYVCA